MEKVVIIVLIVLLLFSSVAFGIQNIYGEELRTHQEVWQEDIKPLLDDDMIVDGALLSTMLGIIIHETGTGFKLLTKILK